MIAFVKVISLILGLMVISKTYYDYKKKNESLAMFLFWTIAWFGIIIISLFPEIIDEMLTLSRAERIGTGTFLGIAIVFLFFVIYRIYVKAHRLEKKVKDIVMKIGLKDIKE